ncbi:HEAT repeat domain-containing protein [Stieleria sp. JC731]|uniref:HEAT repeat domain-containing protein n=1 Tax=Pirellulaceae TaxID=2691357 RepID=UPI001E38B69B|nr:HEAT repeat domain-containing protein [Stieleria sp. JC731]MCC9600698.1 HEAT repeat domain-containing protein [Stieleria sp. JC731]
MIVLENELKSLLGDLESEDEATCRRAIEDLGEARSVAAITPLVALIESPSSAMRELIVDALVSIGGVKTINAVIPLLNSEEPSIRNAACEILYRIGDESIDPLEQLLKHESKDVRKFAIDILSMIGNPNSEEALINALDDDDSNVAAAAAEALGEIRGTKSVDKLISSIGAADSHAWMQCSVAKSLGQIGGDTAVNTLIQLTKQEDPMVVFSAMHALSALQYETWKPVFHELAQHENEVVAEYATLTLQRYGTENLSSDQIGNACCN